MTARPTARLTSSAYARPVRVQVDCPAPWREPVLAALGAAGVVRDATAPVGVAVTPGRLVSDVVDGWSVDSLPHLLVAVQAHAIDVGPWAAPGIGPCARCVAAGVLDDGSRPGGAAEVLTTGGGVPLPLLALAAGAAARDLAAWTRGEVPHSWLTSWRFDHRPLPEARSWRRHPYCGCGWFETG